MRLLDGLRVGHACDADVDTGVTVFVADAPVAASAHVMGGAPGTRETDLLRPSATVAEIDALVFSGGSAFGLGAADEVAGALAARGRGFAVGPVRVPIVPAAILFDLLNGGNKEMDLVSLYRRLGLDALTTADDETRLGTLGAGTGATTANLKGGFGAAEESVEDVRVQAFAAVNALGCVTMGDGPHFWGAAFERDGEVGGLDAPAHAEAAADIRTKGRDPQGSTTLALVATDAVLDKAALERLAIASHDGLARAIWPAHTPLDGDCVFTLSTGRARVEGSEMVDLCAAAARALTRAIMLGVHSASERPSDILPTWRSRFARL